MTRRSGMPGNNDLGPRHSTGAFVMPEEAPMQEPWRSIAALAVVLVILFVFLRALNLA